MKKNHRISLSFILIVILICIVPVRTMSSEIPETLPENGVSVGSDEPENPEISPTYDEKTQDRIHFIALDSEGDASDAILVESNGVYGLIDASHPSGETVENKYPEFTGKGAGGQTVAEYISGIAGADHLSFVIGTHSHSDHIGGIPDIAASGLVDKNTVYIYKSYECMENNNWHNSYYADLALEAMKEKGALLLDLTDPDEDVLSALGMALVGDPADSVGDHVVFSFEEFEISLYNLHTESMSCENLNSIITTIRKGEQKAVLMSDMEMTDGMEERAVSALIRSEGTSRTDIYKVAHHGYPTSNEVGTFAALNPRYAVVCTNRTDKEPQLYVYYNYVLEKTGAEIYRTSDAEAGIIADFLPEDVYIFNMTYRGIPDAATPWVTTYQTN